MSNTTLTLATRDTAIKPKKLRRAGLVPGNIYGGEHSIPVQIDKKVFAREISDLGESTLLYIQLDASSKKIPVLIDEVLTETLSPDPVHVTFRQVDLTETVEAEIEIELEGEVDIHDAILIQLKNSIEVRALPTDLPEKFILNVTTLQAVGDSLTTKDLQYDQSKIELTEISEDEPEITLVQIQGVQEEVVEVEEIVGEVEGEATPESTPAPDGEDQTPAA